MLEKKIHVSLFDLKKKLDTSLACSNRYVHLSSEKNQPMIKRKGI